jgi:hypothetical protein
MPPPHAPPPIKHRGAPAVDASRSAEPETRDPKPDLPTLSALAHRFYRALADGIPAEEAAGLYDSLIGASDDGIYDRIELIRAEPGVNAIPQLNALLPSGPAP